MQTKAQIILPITIFMLFTSAGPTHAESISFSIEPSKLFVRQSLPVRHTEILTITNNSGTLTTLSVQKMTFITKENGKIIPKTPGTKMSQTLSKSLHILENEQPIQTITLLPSESKDIKIYLELGQGSTSRDLNLGLLLKPTNNIENTAIETEVVAKSSVTPAIFLPILYSPSDSVPNISVDSFSVDTLTTDSKPDIELKISNSSKHASSIDYEIAISDLQGKQISRSKFTNKILPSASSFSTRKVPLSRSENSLLSFGPYKATLTLFNAGQTDQKVIYFFVLRLKELIFLTIGILILTFIASRVKRKRNIS